MLHWIGKEKGCGKREMQSTSNTIPRGALAVPTPVTTWRADLSQDGQEASDDVSVHVAKAAL